MRRNPGRALIPAQAAAASTAGEIPRRDRWQMPTQAAATDSSPATWSHRFTLLSMFVYLGKIGDIFPFLNKLHLGKVLIALAILAWLMEGGGRLAGLSRNPVFRPFLGVLAMIVVTLPLGVWPGNTFTYITQTFFKELIFIVLLIVTTRTTGDLRRLAWVFALNALVLDYALHKYGIMEIELMALDRNEIAMVSVMAIGMLLPMHTRGIKTLFKYGLIGMMVMSILVSSSRGGLLGLATVLVTVSYFKLGGKVALTGVVVLALGGLIYIQLPSYVKGRVDSIINYEQDYNLTAQDGRIEIWKRGMSMIASDPLTGVGMRNFPIAEGWMHSGVRGQAWMNAHNSYLQVAAEIGLIGFAFFITMLARMHAASKRLRSQTQNADARMVGFSLTYALTAYLVCGFFLSQGFAPVLYILMAAIVAAARLGAEQGIGAEEKQSPYVLYRKNP